eukprot:15430632-Alexandrium_andersonii.AAC.1
MRNGALGPLGELGARPPRAVHGANSSFGQGVQLSTASSGRRPCPDMRFSASFVQLARVARSSSRH